LKDLLKASTLVHQTSSPKATEQQTTQEDGFQEVLRRKRHASNDTAGISKKAAVQTKTSPSLKIPPLKEVVTRNFFVPLRAADMNTGSSDTQATLHEELVG
jgi:hypothetical protein